jgi:hypothetical protein
MVKEPRKAEPVSVSCTTVQVAVELYNLATQEGLLVLRNMTLGNIPLKVSSVDQLPKHGTLSVRAIATKPTYYNDAPLSEKDFKTR